MHASIAANTALSSGAAQRALDPTSAQFATTVANEIRTAEVARKLVFFPELVPNMSYEV